jgi:glucan phosphoethanolaminetransferase (alkaline phosphatase superfamily)
MFGFITLGKGLYIMLDFLFTGCRKLLVLIFSVFVGCRHRSLRNTAVEEGLLMLNLFVLVPAVLFYQYNNEILRDHSDNFSSKINYWN